MQFQDRALTLGFLGLGREPSPLIFFFFFLGYKLGSTNLTTSDIGFTVLLGFLLLLLSKVEQTLLEDWFDGCLYSSSP